MDGLGRSWDSGGEPDKPNVSVTARAGQPHDAVGEGLHRARVARPGEADFSG